MILAATFITAIVALLALCAACWQLYLLNKQRRRDFEDLFVQRYWAIMDRLSVAAIECLPPKDRKITADDRLAVMSYLRLCEDELDLRAQHWVSTDTWRIWHAGIASQLQRWPFNDVWSVVAKREDLNGNSGQFARLRHAKEDLYKPDFDVASHRTYVASLVGGR